MGNFRVYDTKIFTILSILFLNELSPVNKCDESKWTKCMEEFELEFSMNEPHLFWYASSEHDLRALHYFADKYPAIRARRIAVGIKVSLLLNFVCNGSKTIEFFPEKTNPSKTLTIGQWVKSILFRKDRGFFKFDSFAKINSYREFYLT